jgi:non-specific serine/threonine protein kinase/serine/threonine-protein kinase
MPDGPPTDPPPTVLPDMGDETPRRIGHYTILTLLGEGGMGEVYEAEQTEPVQRRVALKLIKWGMDTRQVVARFESERQALALMNHPNVARVLDAGATEQGRPYFVMDLVRGVPITQYCDSYRLDTRARLELFRQVCDGVQHAHQKGVIHRDIKPSNVLVTIEDDRPVPKLIDFGVAKATTHRLTERTLATEMGQLIGTPEYMSPEQAGASALDVDTRTDVYSLGLVLYELLAGSLPFDPRELRRATYDELCRKIREEEPPRPSTRLGTLAERASDVAEKRDTDAASLVRELRSDLDWIVIKALEKDRTRRYPSASGLSADIGRYLRHEPVQACPPSTAYRLQKFVRRHKLGVAASAIVAAALVVGILGTTVGMLQARRAELRATQEAEAARQVSELLVGLFEVSDPGEAKGREIPAREILDQGAARIGGELQEQPLVQARLMDSIGRVYRLLGYYDRSQPLLEQALATREAELGREHPEVAESLHNLATLAVDRGDYEVARPLFERALAIREAKLGVGDRRVADTVHNLALLHHELGDYDDARPLYRRALAIREQSPPAWALAESLNDLATLYHETGEYEQARELYERALEVATATRGADSPDAADTVHNLATLLYQMGRYREAIPVMERALALSEETLGPDHPDVGVSVNNLAALHHRLGELEAARPLYERSLQIAEEALGPDHRDTGDSLNNLANLLRDQRDFDAARPLYERALSIRQRAMGPGHPSVATSHHDIALLLVEQGDPGGARGHFERAIAIRESALGDDHPATADSLAGLANLLRDAGDFAAAEPLYARALAIRESRLGADHPDVARLRAEYERMLQLTGR